MIAVAGGIRDVSADVLPSSAQQRSARYRDPGLDGIRRAAGSSAGTGGSEAEMIAGEVPLLRVPATWSTPAVAAGAMVLLAALDGLGAVLAKTWVRTGSWTIGGAGLVTFGLLFWVYSSSLRHAELSTVTFGWIVLLQVGLLLADRFCYGVAVPVDKWAAAAGIIVLQAYLLLAPSPLETAH